ncbi:MAG: hypothetical protein OXI24_05815 [Candidatus Poribacteria bacterium]|nr:hypothetical protein [Candidatus Poribacteria bacterium]
MLRSILVACLIAFVAHSQVAAQVVGVESVSKKKMIDVIYFKDGRVVRGKILEKTDQFLIVRAEDGGVSTFEMNQIAGMFQEEASQGTNPTNISRGAREANIGTREAESGMGTNQKESGLGIGKFKIGGGLVVSPELGVSANIGVAVPNLNYRQHTFFLIEGTFDLWGAPNPASVVNPNLSQDTHFVMIGANGVVVYKFAKKLYLFFGAGFARVEYLGEDVTIDFGYGQVISAPLQSAYSSSHLNTTAGVGMDFSILFAEARWSDIGGDLVITVGIKIR